MINQLFIFVVALGLVIKGATLATRYAARLANSFRLSKYTVGFIVVAMISILPETFIAINSAIAGVPEFGLGMLFGSNIADLTLVFAIIILLTGRGIKIQTSVLKNRTLYPFFLLIPLILGVDGHLGRLEGAALIVAGGIFYYLALKNGIDTTVITNQSGERAKHFFWLLLSMALLLLGAHFTVTSATALATHLAINPVLIGMLVVGLGTTMPELFFSLQSVKKRDDELAVGDILGTVLADATIVVGILALIDPFGFPPKIIYVTGTLMLLASLILFGFMRSGRKLSRQEGYLLLGCWITFTVIEFFVNR